jgi:hypothetical protein
VTEQQWLKYEAETKTVRLMPQNYWIATLDSIDGAIDHEFFKRLFLAAPTMARLLRSLVSPVSGSELEQEAHLLLIHIYRGSDPLDQLSERAITSRLEQIMDKAKLITVTREIEALCNGPYSDTQRQDIAERAQRITAILSAPDTRRASELEAQYHDAGYESWGHDIDAHVCRGATCETCKTKGLRYIGLRKGKSRISIAHCDACGSESEF